MAIDQALAVAVFGSADLVKAINGEDDGLICEEHNLGRELFSKQDADRDPVRKLIESSLNKRAGVKDESWDAPISTAAVVRKGTPVICPKGSIGHQLGIVSQEIVVGEDGENWNYGYNAAGELVDARRITE